MKNLKTIALAGIALTVVLSVFSWLMYSTEKMVMDPSVSPRRINAYTDSGDGGNSYIRTSFEKEYVQIVYSLDSGFGWPYVGISLNLGPKNADYLENCPDWTPYDSLVVDVRSKLSTGLTMQLATRIPSGKQAGPSEKHRLLQQSLPISPRWRRISVGIRDFGIPEWWKIKYGLPLNSGDLFLHHTCKVEFVASYLKVGKTDTLQIRSLKLTGNRSWLAWTSVATLTVFWAAFFFFWNRRRLVDKLGREQMLGNYQPLQVKNQGDKELEHLLEYLRSHYQQPELNAELVSRETGLSRRRVGELLKKAFDMTLKAYLNNTRLQEAARLLKESDLQVVQIAYEVGYNTVSHFNRVFKEKFGVAPKEFRSS